MYTSGILYYLLWPAFIAVCWFVIRAAQKYYEKKFPDRFEEN
jgi:hypothetical protein